MPIGKLNLDAGIVNWTQYETGPAKRALDDRLKY